MVISNRVVLAVQIIQVLDQNPDKVINMLQFSEACGKSHGYIQQIARILRESGFIDSVLGPQGGYMRCKELEEIPLDDLIIAVEGALDKSTVTKREQAQVDRFLLNLIQGYSLKDVLNF